MCAKCIVFGNNKIMANWFMLLALLFVVDLCVGKPVALEEDDEDLEALDFKMLMQWSKTYNKLKIIAKEFRVPIEELVRALQINEDLNWSYLNAFFKIDFSHYRSVMRTVPGSVPFPTEDKYERQRVDDLEEAQDFVSTFAFGDTEKERTRELKRGRRDTRRAEDEAIDKLRFRGVPMGFLDNRFLGLELAALSPNYMYIEMKFKNLDEVQGDDVDVYVYDINGNPMLVYTITATLLHNKTSLMHFADDSYSKFHTVQFFHARKGNPLISLGVMSIDRSLIPSPLALGPFRRTTNGVESGPITLLSSRKIKIENFSYDGTGPSVFFYGILPAVAMKKLGRRTVLIPDEKDLLLPLRPYNKETIVLTIPPGEPEVYKFVKFMVYCVKYKKSFGVVEMPTTIARKVILPPSWLDNPIILVSHFNVTRVLVNSIVPPVE